MTETNIKVSDPSQNFIERYPHPLDPLFHPQTVAVIGAKDDIGSVGRTVMHNLKEGYFKGEIYPVNPKRSEVIGFPSYPTIADVPNPVDLAIIITPAPTVPQLISQCVEVGVKSAIVISAGFKELGEPGLKLEKEIILHARRGNMPVIGPNCLGVMNPIYGLNATFAKGMALPGHLAFISQSGAMCTAVLDWSLKEKIGFSSFISIGSMADVNWGTLIDYLGDDPNTHSLLLYMETIGDARSFLTAAREVALEKPIIVIKAGRSQAAAKAAASHTGSLAGSDEIFDAALERVGVLRVNNISELFSMASVLSRQPLPKGPRLSIITNAGGPAVLATDAAVMNHAELTELSFSSIESLNSVLPTAWSHGNPIDILGDADASRFAKSLDIVSKDPHSDGMLVILSPQDMTDPLATAEQIKVFGIGSEKPLLASWMGGESVQSGIDVLSDGKIPSFGYPDDAAKTFATMWRYSQNLQSLYETPVIDEKHPIFEGKSFIDKRASQSKQLLSDVLSEGRSLLTEDESKKILEYYSIPVVRTLVARTPNEAVRLADEIGFPVVLKLFSKVITHKTDVGGVKLNLLNSNDVRNAFENIRQGLLSHYDETYFEGVTVQPMITRSGYELIIGSSTDPQFGPTLLFGWGGQLVEVFKDRSLGFPPLNRTLARRLIEKTKIYEALCGVRGRKPINISYLEDVLIHFSHMIVENPRIKECDINPLLASEEGIIALDARIVLHEAEISDNQLPKLSIRPYPYYYIKSIHLRDGTSVLLRPIRPEDELMVKEFHKYLSENTVRQRYFEFVSLSKRVAHDRLIRICFNDYDREWAIIAEITQDSVRQIIAIGRLSRIIGTNQSQIKLTIRDAFHGLGLGTQIIRHLQWIAKQEKIESIDAFILSENEGMLKICAKLGFKIVEDVGRHPLITHVRWQTISAHNYV